MFRLDQWFFVCLVFLDGEWGGGGNLVYWRLPSSPFCRLVLFFWRLVVRFILHPAARVGSQQQFADFVKHEDEHGEWDGREPPVDFQRVHLQALVHAGRVRQERGQQGLEHQPKVHDPVLHTLLEY